MVSHPLSVRDCCLVTDGGGAIILTSAARARTLKKPPAYVLGCGHGTTHMNISSMPDLTVTPARKLSGWNFLSNFRKSLGLFAFFYALIHLGIYFWFDRSIFWPMVMLRYATLCACAIWAARRILPPARLSSA